MAEVLNFCTRIFWINEFKFINNGIITRWSFTYFSTADSLRYFQNDVLDNFFEIIWLKLINNKIWFDWKQINRYIFLSTNLNFLKNKVSPLLEEVSLDMAHRNMWFTTHDFQVYTCGIQTTFLDRRFQSRLTGNLGSVSWPARSPDIVPIDFLWKYIKNQVYSDQNLVVSVEDIRQRIREGCDNIEPESIAACTNHEFIIRTLGKQYISIWTISR